MRRYFTPDDDETIRAYYTARAGAGLDIDVLAAKMGRTRWSVAMRASRLGLCDQARPKSDAHKESCKAAQRKLAKQPEISAKRSRDKKRWLKTHAHPMTGRRHSAETRRKMSDAHRRRKAIA